MSFYLKGPFQICIQILSTIYTVIHRQHRNTRNLSIYLCLKRAALHKNYTRSTDKANIQVKLLIYIRSSMIELKIYM